MRLFSLYFWCHIFGYRSLDGVSVKTVLAQKSVDRRARNLCWEKAIFFPFRTHKIDIIDEAFLSFYLLRVFILHFFFFFVRSLAMASGVANQVAIYKTMWATFQVNWCWVLVAFCFYGFVCVFVVVVLCLSATFLIRFNIKKISLSHCFVRLVARFGSAGHHRCTAYPCTRVLWQLWMYWCVSHFNISKRWVLVVTILSSMCILRCFLLSGSQQRQCGKTYKQ